MRNSAKYGMPLYADLYRAFFSKKFIFAILSVVAVLLAASLEGINLDTEVIYVFSLVMYGMPAMLVMIGGASAYADSIFSDIEHKYIRGILSRIGTKEYVLSKMLSVYLAGVLSVGIGIFIYVMLLHLRLPWMQAESMQYQYLLSAGGLRFFLSNQMFIPYFMLWSIQYGTLSGMLSVLSTFFSLFIKSKLLVIATPFISYYFIDLLIASISKNACSLALIFAPSNNLWGNDAIAFLVVFVISALFLACIGFLVERKLRKEYLDE